MIFCICVPPVHPPFFCAWRGRTHVAESARGYFQASVDGYCAAVAAYREEAEALGWTMHWCDGEDELQALLATLPADARERGIVESLV